MKVRSNYIFFYSIVVTMISISYSQDSVNFRISNDEKIIQLQNQHGASTINSTILGNVCSNDDLMLDSVLVGFILPLDTVTNVQNINNLSINDFEIYQYSTKGKFKLYWKYGPAPIPYSRLMAYKPGYLIWRFEEKKSNVSNVGVFTDSLNIVLHKK